MVDDLSSEYGELDPVAPDIEEIVVLLPYQPVEKGAIDRVSLDGET